VIRRGVQYELPSTFLQGLGPQRCGSDFVIYNTKYKVGHDTSAENHCPIRGFPYSRTLSRFRCKVGLQWEGTWFTSRTEQCPR